MSKPIEAEYTVFVMKGSPLDGMPKYKIEKKFGVKIKRSVGKHDGWILNVEGKGWRVRRVMENGQKR